ncbi:MAG: SusE domain-containing protein [Cyclobacteriaceae bacterium]|nr:SusE domain-containing protein [Cyclobacteriaceae bacterium]MDX5465306.1 SusE domain-containing protein [Cyclobacteriaceae bacterium]
MKKIINLAGFFAVLPLIWGCEYEFPPIIPQTGSEISAPAAGTSIVLQKDNAEESFIEFTVTAADFGTSGEVTNILQLDLPGAEFSAPVDLGSSKSNIIEVNVAELNDALLEKGLPFGTSANVEFRVKSTIAIGLLPIVGESTTLSITPYDATVAFPVMYVPGDYQGWDPTNEMTVLYSENFDKKFKGYIHILGGSREFKVNETNSWDINYGDDGANGTLEKDGANIKVGADGTYEMNVDLNAKTYTLGAVKRWGIVGDATPGGWDADTPMNVFDKTTNSLKITTSLKAGEFKFRANNNWDNNFGGANGELSAGGPNIKIESAGNYTISLYFGPAGKVSYTLVKN